MLEVARKEGRGVAGGGNRQMVALLQYNPNYATARLHHGSHPGASSMKCHQLVCLNTGYVCSRPPTACQNTCFLCCQQMPNVLKQGSLQESVQYRTGARRCFWGVFLEVMKIPRTELSWERKHPSWTHTKEICHWPIMTILLLNLDPLQWALYMTFIHVEWTRNYVAIWSSKMFFVPPEHLPKTCCPSS